MDISNSKKQEEHSYVVRVLCSDRADEHELRFLGSGFFVKDALVVTCAHIFKEDDNGTDFDVDKTPIYIFPQGTEQPIRAEVIAIEPERDLAILGVSSPQEVCLPTLLSNVIYQYKGPLTPTGSNPIVCTFVGYTASDDGHEYLVDLLKYKGPTFKKGILKRLRIDGGIERGGSGAPVFIEVSQQNLCIGVACYSGKGAPTTFIVSSDTVIDFLNENGFTVANEIDASHVFPLGHLSVIQERVSSSKFIRDNILSGGHHYWRRGAFALILLVLAAIGFWQGRSDKNSASKASYQQNTQPTLQRQLVPIEYQVKQRSGLNILVLSFRGSDQDSIAEGNNSGLALKEKIEAYKSQQEKTTLWADAHLKAEDLHTDFANHPVSNPDDARSVGLSRQADLIIWGSITSQTIGLRKKYSITPYVTSIKWNALNSTLDTMNPNGVQTRLPKELTKALDIMMALYAYDRQRYTVAAPYFRSSLDAIMDTEDSWRLLLVAAEALFSLHEHKTTTVANNILEKIKSVCTTNDDCFAHYWALMAGEQHRQGKDREALEIYENHALPLIAKLNEISLYVNTLMNAAELHEAKGEDARALKLANTALSLTSALPHILANSLGDQVTAWVELRKGNINGAIAKYEHILDVIDPVLALEKKGIILGELAKAYFALGDMSKVDEKSKASLAIWEKLNAPRKQSYILANLGTMWFDKHDYAEAIPHLQRAADIFHSLHQADNEARVLGRLAVCYLNTHQSSELQATVVRVTPLIGALGSTHLDGSTYECLAAVFSDSGKVAQAIDFMNRALDILLKEGANGNMLGHLYEKKATYEVQAQEQQAAADSYHKAAQFFQKQADPKEASFALDAACDLSVRLGKPMECGSLLVELQKLNLGEPMGLLEQARMLTRMGKQAEAIALYKEASKLIERIEPVQREYFQKIIARNIERISNWKSFESCMGVILTGPQETANARQANPLRDGDIVVKIDEQCASSLLYMRDILMSSRSINGQPKKARVWRNGSWIIYEIPAGNSCSIKW